MLSPAISFTVLIPFCAKKYELTVVRFHELLTKSRELTYGMHQGHNGAFRLMICLYPEGKMMTLEQLRQQVLLLPVQDRASLIRELIESLETSSTDEGISQAWLDEIARRSDALHRGEMKCDDWRTSLGRVRERLADKLS